MPQFTNIYIAHGSGESSSDVTRLLQADETTSKAAQRIRLENFVGALGLGVRQAQVIVSANAVKASGTITLASHVATNTVTINGVVFTCVASGATGNQYNVGGSDTITATNLAAAVNASVTAKVSGYLVATSAAAVVTITAVKPGLSANMFTLAISANGSVSGANLTGGTEGTAVTTNYGSN